MTNRRFFMLGAGALIAAPAIVRAESLMKLFVPKPELIPYLAPSEELVSVIRSGAISRAQLLAELLPGLNALFGIEYSRHTSEMAQALA